MKGIFSDFARKPTKSTGVELKPGTGRGEGINKVMTALVLLGG